MGEVTRDRKDRFLRSFDADSRSMKTAITAISERIYRDGLDWLTDEQLDQITSDVLQNYRFSQRLMIRNRNLLRRAS
ncbi:hypothetical protein OIU35_31795 [Boseaceae bacterium BT-24-1]|nr:hypothetical protein [Boseaceae bacterium BT-24-1]